MNGTPESLMDEKIDNSDKSLLKGISIFGGVQIFQVLISIIRGKFVAMFLGPEGMGINTLYNSALNTVQIFGSLGLNLAIVKEISANHSDEAKLSGNIALAIRLIFITAIFGALICFALSPLLSRITFGNYSATVKFMALSLSLFFSIAAAGKLSVLQGLHQVKKLSRASLVSAIAGLILGVPLYWFMGVNGIVPAIILMSAAMYFFYSHTLKKCRIPVNTSVKLKSSKPAVKKLIATGLMLVLGNLVTTGAIYFINLFIRTFGDMENVGFFQAANSITMQYVGIVFSAMAVDYLPRLSRNISDNSYVRDLANRQITLLTYIVSPIVCGMILTAPILIKLLLTPEFEQITELIRWMGFGILLRAINYPLGYITFAKDNKKVYIWTEVVFYNAAKIAISCTAYYFYGIIGLGLAVIADGIIGIITDYLVQKKLYSFRFNKQTLIGIALSVILSSAALASSFMSTIPAYTAMSLIFLTSLFITFHKIKSSLK